jgi:hypothetical protein
MLLVRPMMFRFLLGAIRFDFRGGDSGPEFAIIEARK